MVGYCDLCDTRFGRFEVIDFVGKDEASSFRTFLTGVRAVGGGDTCEDILGGLQVHCVMQIRETVVSHTKT